MKLAIHLLTYLLTFSSPAASLTTDASHLFSLRLHGLEVPVKAGSEIRLRVTLTNTSDHDLSFGIAPGETPDQTLSYTVDIRDARGQQAPPTAFLRDLREHRPLTAGSVFGYTLSPGKSYEEELVITKLYVLSHPGRYTIQVARSQKPWPNPASNVKSNAIAIIVGE